MQRMHCMNPMHINAWRKPVKPHHRPTTTICQTTKFNNRMYPKCNEKHKEHNNKKQPNIQTKTNTTGSTKKQQRFQYKHRNQKKTTKN